MLEVILVHVLLPIAVALVPLVLSNQVGLLGKMLDLPVVYAILPVALAPVLLLDEPQAGLPAISLHAILINLVLSHNVIALVPSAEPMLVA